MDRVTSREEIVDIVRQEVAAYADVNGINAKFYYVENTEQQLYAVIAIPQKWSASGLITVAVRVDGDRVIIERDNTTKPLYEELLRKGIPDEQIILVYEGTHNT
jgi:hypothetical protein